MSFKLFPSQIRSQSMGAISKLRDNNSSLEQSKRALQAFISDPSLNTVSYRNLKMKSSDLQEIALSIIAANEADEMAYLNLNAGVGDEVLIGEVILANQQSARDAISRTQDVISSQQRSLNNPAIDLNPAIRVSIMESIRANQALLQSHQDLLRKWLEKEQDYHRIEGATAGLFNSSRDLRQAITTGFSLIVQAASGLPHSYNNIALEEWRMMNRLERERVQASTDIARQRIIEKLILGETTLCALMGDPVNMSTGNYIYKRVDLTIGGRHPLSFQRFYNSMCTDFSYLGKGWSHSYEIYITHDDKGASVFYGVDGHSEFYELKKQETGEEESITSSAVDNIESVEGRKEQTEGKVEEQIEEQLQAPNWESYEYLASENNQFSHLTRTKEGGYLLHQQDGSILSFEPSGVIASLKDRDGNETSFEYDGLTLLKVTTDSGSLAFEYEELRSG